MKFQSSPPEFGGRVGRRLAQCYGMVKFQSSPPEFGGRVRGSWRRRRPGARFNPRPPNSGGASPQGVGLARGERVSILAPRIRGARRQPGRCSGRLPRFQSSPPEFGGRVGCQGRILHAVEGFNPRPPNSGGASVRAQQADFTEVSVHIARTGTRTIFRDSIVFPISFRQPEKSNSC